MTNKDRILSVMTTAEICDDCLSDLSGVHPRQTIYQVCSQLSESSLILRYKGICKRCRKNKIVSQVPDNARSNVETAVSKKPMQIEPDGTNAWYWEGNVKGKVVSYLVQKGYTIRSVANTTSREQGKDIVALEPDGNELWISVKGYPEKSQHVQARHWFSQVIFDLILYRGTSSTAKLALALPEGFTTYANLSPRVEWLKQTMPFEIFWVSENGSVRVE
ncbi:hypothetical protein EV586_10936 [Tumebacillus sp. BK434]|uniref:hypothetical protein n=1 Tax=Tumebacillus sp. BK434 TaxID=2512169 RepID=UPI0010449129|nr:hypothetical protein [Tumebacillus sp. BK434]TCP52555.1 hypothetical protein EV586_10936 [Tumebacillus sp. BK434]